MVLGLGFGVKTAWDSVFRIEGPRAEMGKFRFFGGELSLN